MASGQHISEKHWSEEERIKENPGREGEHVEGLAVQAV